MGEWERGRVGEWESGRVGEWESGGVGDCASGTSLLRRSRDKLVLCKGLLLRLRLAMTSPSMVVLGLAVLPSKQFVSITGLGSTVIARLHG